MAADFHERAKFFVYPDIDHFVAAGGVVRFVDADFVAGLTTDIFAAFELWIGPIEKPQRKVLIGQVGAGDGCDELAGV